MKGQATPTLHMVRALFRRAQLLNVLSGALAGGGSATLGLTWGSPLGLLLGLGLVLTAIGCTLFSSITHDRATALSHLVRFGVEDLDHRMDTGGNLRVPGR